MAALQRGSISLGIEITHCLDSHRQDTNCSGVQSRWALKYCNALAGQLAKDVLQRGSISLGIEISGNRETVRRTTQLQRGSISLGIEMQSWRPPATPTVYCSGVQSRWALKYPPDKPPDAQERIAAGFNLAGH